MTEHARSRLTTHAKPVFSGWFKFFLDSRVSLVPWLGLTGVGLLTLLYIFFSVPPAHLANLLLPRLYLPLLASFFLIIFSMSIYLWRHVRRGILTGLACQAVLFLYLQHIQVGWQLIGVILISFVIMEMGFVYLERRSPPLHATTNRRHHRFDHAQ